jgi:hypothetical protein
MLRNLDAEYGARLGELYANLVSLEFSLHVTLYLYETPRAQRRLPSFKYPNLESWLSSSSSLNDAIEAYNKMQAAEGRPQIDAGIIDLRNAVAHGRISGGSSSDDPMTVEKHVMTLDKVRAQSDRARSTLRAVCERMSELQE